MPIAKSNSRSDPRALAFLRRGPLMRVDDRWRFGGARIDDRVVDRLIAAGKAIRLWKDEPGDCVMLTHRVPRQ